MVHEPVVECTFFIPIRRDVNLSDGELHEEKTWGWLDLELFHQFGGRTVAPGLYTGFYTDPDTGEQIDDESRQYIVAVSEPELDKLRSLLSACCVLFQQKCLYLSIAGRVEFIEAPDHEPT